MIKLEAGDRVKVRNNGQESTTRDGNPSTDFLPLRDR